MSVQVILRQDIEKLGEAGSLQTVKPGFARNYLIPKGLAIMATPGELKNYEHNQAINAKKVERQERELQSFADKIASTKLDFQANVGENGRLFGSVTAADIAEKLSAAVGEPIDRRKVVLSEPIRSVGDHQVTVQVVGKLQPKVKVTVHGVSDEPEATPETNEATDAE